MSEAAQLPKYDGITPAAREVWLARATDLLRPIFDGVGCTLPKKIRVSCSWPSKGATAKKKRANGQCWDPKASADQTTEIFISPIVEEREEVLAILIHELAHAGCGIKAGHRGPFKQTVSKLGLIGPATTSEPGDDFLQRYCDVFATCGGYPHARINPDHSGIAKQGTRMIKCQCEKCDYVVRGTRKHLKRGLPVCPCGGTLQPDQPLDDETVVLDLPEDAG